MVQSFLMEFHFRQATSAWRVIFIMAAVNLLCGPQFSWVPIFLKTFLLCHATVAWRVIFLPATVNLLLDSLLAWILPFGFWQPDSSPYAASSVLRPASLLLLP
jgi:hypothetical protein